MLVQLVHRVCRGSWLETYVMVGILHIVYTNASFKESLSIFNGVALDYNELGLKLISKAPPKRSHTCRYFQYWLACVKLLLDGLWMVAK